MDKLEKTTILWTDYIKYRAELRRFDLDKIEEIMRYSDERYFDVVTRRSIVIGRHGHRTVMIPYEKSQNTVTPVTIHTIAIQQIKFRLKTGRFVYE